MSVVVASLCLGAGPVFAQQVPDAGTLLKGLQQDTVPAPSAPLAAPAQTPRQLSLPKGGSSSVLIRTIHLDGMTVFDEATLHAVVAPWEGKKLTLDEMRQATDAIVDYYRSHDHLARVWLPEQDIEHGQLTIRILEGHLGKVIIDPSLKSRLDPDLATSRITSRTPEGAPLDVGAVSEGVAVLNETPGVSARGTLTSGANRGDTDVVLSLQDQPLVSGTVQVDNAGLRSTGNNRVIGQAALNDPLGRGGQLSLTTVQSSRSSYGRVAAQAPLGASGMTLELHASALRYSLGEEYKDLAAHGYAWTSGALVSYPVHRSSDFSLTAMGGYDHKRLVSEVSNVLTGDSRIDVAHAGLTTTARDSWLGGGLTQGTVTLSFGHVGLSSDESLRVSDSTGPAIAGNYGKLMIHASRLQKIVDGTAASVNVTGQLASGNLDSSEKISLGGLSGVRAYPSSEAYGDDGIVSQLELRHQLMPGLTLSGFYDVGAVQLHHTKWDDWETVEGQPNSYILQGVGVGVTWVPVEHVQVRGLVAQPLGPNPGHDANGYDSDGKKTRPRVWLAAAISF